MATTRTRKTTKTAEEAATQVVGTTLENDIESEAPKGETIAIACCLPFGLKFDDIPNGRGGTKTIRLPGLNAALRGKRTGVLALPGNAVCVQLAKADWDALIKIHGREIAFTGRNGGMPCVYPVGDLKGFKSARSEIAEMKHGLEAVAPDAMGVEEANAKRD